MALNIGGYVDPGVYIGEVVSPSSISLNTLQRVVGIVGVGSRTKMASNEAVTRGLVLAESLTFSGNAATLTNTSDRKISNTTLYADGVEVRGSRVSFGNPTVTGSALAGAVDFTTTNLIAVQLDNKQVFLVKLSGGASDAVSALEGNKLECTVGGASTNAMSAAQIVYGLNLALAQTPALGLGSGAASLVGGNKIKLTSSSSGANAGVKVMAAFPGSESATVACFGSASLSSASVLLIDSAAFDEDAVYTVDYIALDSSTDALANDAVSVKRVGAYANVSTYSSITDWTLSSGMLEWSDGSKAELMGTPVITNSGLNLTTAYSLSISIDNKPSLTVYLCNESAMPYTPPGWVEASSLSAVTASEIANNINAWLASSLDYGPEYKSVASVESVTGGDSIKLTSPTSGSVSHVGLSSAGATDAASAVLGVSAAQMPLDESGSGARPSPGAVYFATYGFDRPLSEYNTPIKSFSRDQAMEQVGEVAPENKLAIAAEIAFENGAPFIYTIQVNDSTSPGTPTRAQFQAALLGCESKSDLTEVVILSTNSAVQVDVSQHVTSQSSPTEKNYRRGWFGMARDTDIGDKDTEGTLRFLAGRTMQVQADSPGRGRLIVAAPCNVSRTLVLSDGSETVVDLDGSFVALAQAARFTSLTSSSDSLLRKQIAGFNTGDFQTYLKAERGLLAAGGVSVATLDAGRLLLTDPVTTEQAGGGLPQFIEPSSSGQKDAVTRAVEAVIDSNLVGIVPDDMASFIYTIKNLVGLTLSSLIERGEIGPFRTQSGAARGIDYATDIQVMQSASNPTKFNFRYYYNLKYPAKRFFGEYSVDNPFFGVGGL